MKTGMTIHGRGLSGLRSNGVGRLIVLVIISFAALAIYRSTASTATGTVVLDGQWLSDKTETPGTVRLTIQRGDGSWTNFMSSLELPITQLSGLSETVLNSSAGAVGQFKIDREAGTIQCEGWFKDGDGSGHFKFIPNRQYVASLNSLGYSDLSDEKLLPMAVYDVTIEFINELQSMGYSHVEVGKLVAMRMHKVTPDFIRELESLGYNHPAESELIAMRVHSVGPEFIRDLAALGYNQVPLAQLVAMKIHGADAQFIRQLKQIGFTDVPVADLIAMRIHDVSIDYIKQMQGRGLQRLTVSQLISLKIHGF